MIFFRQCQSVKALFYVLIFSKLGLVFGNHIKGLDDSILFRINWPGQQDSLLESPDYETLEMTTVNNERFQCLVPIHYGESPGNEDKYTGPNALELLMPLFKKKICTLRLEAFWTYELCHGQWIKQYHESRDGTSQRFQDYSLGGTSLEALQELSHQLDASLIETPQPEIPQTKLEGMSVPYFPVNYLDGTPCDLTGGAPRVTRVLYVCYEEGRNSVYSVKETFTCEYEVVVLAPALCQHPAYRPQEVPQTDLHCIPLQEGTKRPTSLIHIEAESLKLRTHGTTLGGDISGGSVHIEVLGEEEAEILSDFSVGGALSPPVGGEKVVRSPPASPFMPLADDQKMIEDFLKGEYCLQGGAGWWKYEFCHGGKVIQFHDARDGSRVSIILGLFNVPAHKEWLAKHPSKSFHSGKGQVSHLYSGGEVCEATGRARQVEVRLKCKQAISHSSVSLYLLEPKTCEYILGVETPLICPLLKHADEFGLFSFSDFKKEEEEAGLDTKDKAPPTAPVWEGGFTPIIPLSREGEGDVPPHPDRQVGGEEVEKKIEKEEKKKIEKEEKKKIEKEEKKEEEEEKKEKEVETEEEEEHIIEESGVL